MKSPAPFQPGIALNYANFVEVAYGEYLANPKVVNPSFDQYPNFPQGYKLIGNIQMTDFFWGDKDPVYYGFIASKATTPDEIVVAIRGTVDYMEWWDNLHLWPSPCPFGANSGKVVTGFLDIYNTLKVQTPGSSAPARPLSEALTAFDAAVTTIDVKTPITITGHSLGASLATLYALLLAAKGHAITLYTFASPCTGDSAFVSYFDSVITTSYRVHNKPDLVPKILQELPFYGYAQVLEGIEKDSLLDPGIKQTLACFHALTTYMFLLGGPASLLGNCVKPKDLQ